MEDIDFKRNYSDEFVKKASTMKYFVDEVVKILN